MQNDTELTATLSREERKAVRHAAREMRRHRQHKAAGTGAHNGQRSPRPDQAIADLHERGVIDQAREASLTALALRVSRGEVGV